MLLEYKNFCLIRDSYEMSENDKNSKDVKPVSSAGCIVVYFIFGALVFLFFAWFF